MDYVERKYIPIFARQGAWIQLSSYHQLRDYGYLHNKHISVNTLWKQHYRVHLQKEIADNICYGTISTLGRE